MKERKIHLDLMRILATFAVIILHVAALNWYTTPVSSDAWKSYNVYHSLVRFCIPIFVMISGVFFLDPEKEIDIKTLYKRYISKIVIVFIFWSILYASYYDVILPIIRNQPISIKTFLREVIMGNYHMWFLFMIVGLYMITPFLRAIVRDKQLTQYFIALWFIFGILINFTTKISGSGMIKMIKLILDSMHLDFIFGYSGYFVLGWYFYHNAVNKRQEYGIYFLGIISALLTIYLTYFTSLQKNEPVETFYNYLSTNVMLASLAVFVFFNQRVSKLKFSEGLQNRIVQMSLATFGVYLIHPLMIDLLCKLGISTLNLHPSISVLILSILTYCISYFAVQLLRKIPVFQKLFL